MLVLKWRQITKGQGVEKNENIFIKDVLPVK